MRCEKCNKNNAVVRLQKIKNGKITEIFLCNDCSDDFEISMLVENIFHELFSHAKIAFIEQIKDNSHACRLKCTSCGITFHEIKKDGNLGCAVCYTSFSEPLIHAIDEAHGTHVHDGKYPTRRGATLKHEITHMKIRLLMQRAVKEENFEQAAMYRDKLRLHDFLTTAFDDDNEEDSDR